MRSSYLFLILCLLKLPFNACMSTNKAVQLEVLQETSLIDFNPEYNDLTIVYIGSESLNDLFNASSDSSKVLFDQFCINSSSFIFNIEDELNGDISQILPIKTDHYLKIESKQVSSDDVVFREGRYQLGLTNGFKLSLNSKDKTEYWSSIIRPSNMMDSNFIELGYNLSNLIFFRLASFNFLYNKCT